VDEWMNGWKDGWIGGRWVDEWIDRWMVHGWLDVSIISNLALKWVSFIPVAYNVYKIFP
jgi:hypothetical protein